MSLTTLSIPCLAGDTTKYCLTPPERRQIVTQAYQLQECDSLQKSLKKQVFSLNNVVFDDKILIKDLNDNKELMDKQLVAKSNDVTFLTKQLHTALVKNKRQRLLTYAVGVLGTVTTVWFVVH